MGRKNKKSKKSKQKGNTVAATYVQPTQCIKDYVDYKNQGVILLDHPTMQTIYEKSGPNAKGNEFQVHYWGLTMRHTAEDGSRLDICIPTCYFNYKQEVNAAHIDFMLSDVGELSAKVMPVHNMKVNELQALDVKGKFEAQLGIELEYIATDFNSIHRHPGSSRSQAFSSTDLSKSRADLGVVYPLEKAGEDRSNFAGIMAIDGTTCNIAHYEYRVANGDIDGVGGMSYTQGRCAAMVAHTPKIAPPSFIETLFGFGKAVSGFNRFKNCATNNTFEALLTIYESLDYKPFAETIDPDNVTTRTYSYNKTNYNGSYTSKKSAAPTLKEYRVASKTIKKLKDITIYTRVALEAMSIEELKPIVKLYKQATGLLASVVYGNHKILVSDAVTNGNDIIDDLKEAREVKNKYLAIIAKKTPITTQEAIKADSILVELRKIEINTRTAVFSNTDAIVSETIRKLAGALSPKHTDISYVDGSLYFYAAVNRVMDLQTEVEERRDILEEEVFTYNIHKEAAEKKIDLIKTYCKEDSTPANQPGNAVTKTTTNTKINYFNPRESYFRNKTPLELSRMSISELEGRRQTLTKFYLDNEAEPYPTPVIKSKLIEDVEDLQICIVGEIEAFVRGLSLHTIEAKKLYCTKVLNIPDTMVNSSVESTLDCWIAVFSPK